MKLGKCESNGLNWVKKFKSRNVRYFFRFTNNMHKAFITQIIEVELGQADFIRAQASLWA